MFSVTVASIVATYLCFTYVLHVDLTYIVLA